MKCPFCGSNSTRVLNVRAGKRDTIYRKYRCTSCYKSFTSAESKAHIEDSFDECTIYDLKKQIDARVEILLIIEDKQEKQKLKAEIATLKEMCKIMKRKNLFRWGEVYDS